jgi:hypothetical protein
MPAAEYHAAPGLSNGQMKDLLISAFHYWDRHRNPESLCAATIIADGKRRHCNDRRVDHPTSSCKYFQRQAETPAMRLGTALHAAVLESDTFLDRYSYELTKADFPDALETVEDIKEWLDGRCVVYKKSEPKPKLIEIAKSIDPTVQIMDDLMRGQFASNRGKVVLKKQEYDRVFGMAKALLREPALRPILAKGKREVSIFAIDPETGVLVKCRYDWLDAADTSQYMGRGSTPPGRSLDLKTYSERGEDIDRTIMKAIRYEGYDRQGWFYRHVARLAGLGEVDWHNAFVSSETPYEVRIKVMGPGYTPTSRYWEEAGGEVMGLIRRYARLQQEFGDEPWAYQQDIEPVRDSEMPGIGYREREAERVYEG